MGGWVVGGEEVGVAGYVGLEGGFFEFGLRGCALGGLLGGEFEGHTFYVGGVEGFFGGGGVVFVFGEHGLRRFVRVVNRVVRVEKVVLQAMNVGELDIIVVEAGCDRLRDEQREFLNELK